MISSTTLSMVDGTRIVVPDSLDLITPYVLQEQWDWFEDEIKFLRRALQPGQRVIDIGANFGVYTLSMGKTVGPSGSVWAFEPSSSTAGLLAEGIAANSFTHVVLERSALSASCGTARLSLNENSELNGLIRGAQATGASEIVPVLTLDQCLERHGWRDIAFMKMDAEGEEANILKGGTRFFAELSPLVQYEVKAGQDLHMELVRSFAEFGYRSYRLVPGLDFLAPFDPASGPDGYLLNLFCCKPDRSARLAARGLLLEREATVPNPRAKWFRNMWDKVANRRAYGWRETLARLPYGIRLEDLWERTMAAGDHAEMDEALSQYARSRDSALSPRARFGALQTSLELLSTLCERDPSHLRLASLARVARDYGARSLAVSALERLANAIVQQNRVDAGEPFLAPGERFESIAPGEAIGDWLFAAVLEELELLGSFSSFYTGLAARQRLELIRKLGFGSSEMDRRLSLMQRRFGLPAS